MIDTLRSLARTEEHVAATFEALAASGSAHDREHRLQVAEAAHDGAAKALRLARHFEQRAAPRGASVRRGGDRAGSSPRRYRLTHWRGSDPRTVAGLHPLGSQAPMPTEGVLRVRS